MPVPGAQLAGGGGQMPSQSIPQAPQTPQQAPAISPDGGMQGGDTEKMMQALTQALQQSVDQNGFVDMNRLVEIWPQVAQSLGLNVPFETMLQMLQQNPQIINDLSARLGLKGITANGQQISGQDMVKMGQGQMQGGG